MVATRSKRNREEEEEVDEAALDVSDDDDDAPLPNSSPVKKRARHASFPSTPHPSKTRNLFMTPTHNRVLQQLTPYPINGAQDTPSNPFGRKRIQSLIRSLPPVTSFRHHLPLRFQFIRKDIPYGQGKEGVYRIVQVPLSYTFVHLRCLIAFLFGVEVGERRRVDIKGKGKALEEEDDHLFEVKKDIVQSDAEDKPGHIKSGRTWAKLSSTRDPCRWKAEEMDVDEEEDVDDADEGSRASVAPDEEEDWQWKDEEDFTLHNAWHDGLNLKRGIVYTHNRTTQVHITINESPVERRAGKGNTPYVFRAKGRVFLCPSCKPSPGEPTPSNNGVDSQPSPPLSTKRKPGSSFQEKLAASPAKKLRRSKSVNFGGTVTIKASPPTIELSDSEDEVKASRREGDSSPKKGARPSTSGSGPGGGDKENPISLVELSDSGSEGENEGGEGDLHDLDGGHPFRRLNEDEGDDHGDEEQDEVDELDPEEYEDSSPIRESDYDEANDADADGEGEEEENVEADENQEEEEVDENEEPQVYDLDEEEDDAEEQPKEEEIIEIGADDEENFDTLLFSSRWNTPDDVFLKYLHQYMGPPPIKKPAFRPHPTPSKARKAFRLFSDDEDDYGDGDGDILDEEEDPGNVSSDFLATPGLTFAASSSPPSRAPPVSSSPVRDHLSSSPFKRITAPSSPPNGHSRHSSTAPSSPSQYHHSSDYSYLDYDDDDDDHAYSTSRPTSALSFTSSQSLTDTSNLHFAKLKFKHTPAPPRRKVQRMRIKRVERRIERSKRRSMGASNKEDVGSDDEEEQVDQLVDDGVAKSYDISVLDGLEDELEI
ncbi:hypothetical protein CC1G_05248 [Coprinopsis cinerea okayama7|uniref:Uncharacterized protein n=1 Tax=Coprinopsis cinerea (strain Okayama-7 / 130 / ATCC MYA-4618 / FGSC 9003) TaxID=240176 RepID=A8PCC3_COPC7|nr:hypothetical protein CC1G_05248 [Coprinopsis cinerea okayama7\|eukprot:XP_001840362.1 hypothetical protein CC1G_05248 [Coprinopsis cinerea okayama7\